MYMDKSEQYKAPFWKLGPANEVQVRQFKSRVSLLYACADSLTQVYTEQSAARNICTGIENTTCRAIFHTTELVN